MSQIHSKDTGPELIVRKELWRLGFHYRLNVRKLPGTPDIVIGKYRTAIFINGCFWHGHYGCSKSVLPKSNVDFWKDKISRNKERDVLNIQRLEALAWNVITIWECELTKQHLPDTMKRVESELLSDRDKWEAYKSKRKQNRRFAIEQASKHRKILALVETELNSQFHIKVKPHGNTQSGA